MTSEAVIEELNGLIDSLDEHVTIADVGHALGELRDRLREKHQAAAQDEPPMCGEEHPFNGHICSLTTGHPAGHVCDYKRPEPRSAPVQADRAALIAEVKGYPPVVEWDEPGEVDALIQRLVSALENTVAPQGEPTDVQVADILVILDALNATDAIRYDDYVRLHNMVGALATGHGEVRRLADAMGFIDQTVYANTDSRPDLKWSNAEVLELLGMIRERLITSGQEVPDTANETGVSDG